MGLGQASSLFVRLEMLGQDVGITARRKFFLINIGDACRKTQPSDPTRIVDGRRLANRDIAGDIASPQWKEILLESTEE